MKNRDAYQNARGKNIFVVFENEFDASSSFLFLLLLFLFSLFSFFCGGAHVGPAKIWPLATARDTIRQSVINKQFSRIAQISTRCSSRFIYHVFFSFFFSTTSPTNVALIFLDKNLMEKPSVAVVFFNI